MNRYFVRVNGVGNAWPIPLGTEHAFYNAEDPEQLANASFSLIKSSSAEPQPENIEWEILIDAGHGIVQYLIRHGNRMPDFVVLSHAHLDHTLSMDWITQSFYRLNKKEKKIPLYSSKPGWDFYAASYPHLPSLTEHHELKPGEPKTFEGIPELKLIPLPVYHGEKSLGPNMLVFELSMEGKDPVKIIFSGDLLCPLLRKADYRYLRDTEMIFVDANNRFPYTACNHWSISGKAPDGRSESKYLKSFRQQVSCTHLIAPHIPSVYDPVVHKYFDEFLAYCDESIPFSVFDFCKRVSPTKVMLVHYSGMEDKNHNGGEILNPVQLENWSNASAELGGVSGEFIVPQPGDLYELI